MTKRIEFVDLAKGICILMVVVFHIGLPDLPGIKYMRMPFYYVLSGLFFKDYGGFSNFLVKKTNKLVIPFVFFYVLSYLYFYIINAVKPDLLPQNVHGILDIFRGEWIFNGPIWFLLSLFWTNIIFFIIYRFMRPEFLRAISVLLCAVIGYLLSKNHINVYGYIDVSLTVMPYFYFGYLLKKTDILYPNKYDKHNLLIALLLYMLALSIEKFFYKDHIWYMTNDFVGIPIIVYVQALIAVMFMLLLCKTIKHIPVISYLGRYSIIILLMHRIIYRPIQMLFINYFHFGQIFSNISTLILTIILFYYILIPYSIKYIPYFTAQKDLIKLNTKDKTEISPE